MKPQRHAKHPPKADNKISTDRQTAQKNARAYREQSPQGSTGQRSKHDR